MKTSPGTPSPEALIRALLAEAGEAGDAAAALGAYFEELARWNRRFNLTGLRDPAARVRKHLGDTLTLLPLVPPGPARVIDIGTGAGVPGLLLKILRPRLQVVLVDAVARKVSFLRAVIARLGLEGIWAEHGRVGEPEVPRRRPGGGFDLAVSQAVGSLAHLAALAGPVLGPRGMLVAMKGPGGAAELEAARAGLRAAGWAAEPVTARVPLTGHPRCLVVLRRVGEAAP
ncbi:16S rRNA (guanine(527)-N(7))-methyltransferase RsmG [Dissulfurirhabdus thermomarina]|uniref:Ribosomal RNA small subunit methyltransferase G n=1 Tax=Dissulfurirhabdus thermomarina TaxID=1765737 RepID=A0A6N9TJK8_DISTH|nr:16S rRNA (guanine(527)-N(7))-methyltransferase RsmG [Dissulfurirhabdus thermomarina]NDY41435.1 16S rRNA (guanine(527)-N(7))-methyltransferase RsmG [Dissulfurirhabdus thermomarina]NMX24423.1 16S rRNA (guanine(527)-N(7))-methyltransferase RsmG [Dissulfurirhabdus thermomarina]